MVESPQLVGACRQSPVSALQDIRLTPRRQDAKEEILSVLGVDIVDG
jgi:hypothetical protein